MIRIACLLLTLAAALAAPPAVAQPYPSKPIRFVVPFAAGGGTDILARLIGQKLAEAWGQPVLVENRPGATGNIGMEIVARAAPDGYTIAMMINAHAVNTTLYEKLPFDPVADFTTIVLAATTANVLVVHPAVPVTTVAELVALAKRDPGALNYASGGSGTTSHLAAELFKTMTGTSMTHVPYKGGGAAYKDMLGGQVQLSFTGLPGVAEFIRAGKLRAIAVTTPARSNALPGVPTIAETLPGFEFTTWWGIVGPPGLPRPIVARIHDEVTRAVQLPELKEKFAVQGFEFAPSTPESFGAFLREEIARWGKVVKASGARAE